MPDTNITPEVKAMFEALISGEYGNFALVSCFVNGEPTAAIATINESGEGGMDIQPLFVAVTPSMKVEDHDGREATALPEAEASSA